ncbi:MAG: hypothetical protein HY202_07885 [Nitrospirae bacterium]|nr:hypothetical protein [Nitrospirota bacterium]
MALDKTTIIQNAQKYAVKGQVDKAIEEWQKLIKETPNDGNIYNTIGDLYLKKNNNSEAVSSYLKAASAFDQGGFSLKTIAVYKKIIKIEPDNVDIYIKLADLDADRGLIGNAIEEYLKVIQVYTKKGFHKDSIQIYKKIVNLDPGNIPMRLKLSEICLREGAKKDAVEQYIQIAATYKAGNKTFEAEEILRKAMALDPGNSQAAQLLAEYKASPVTEAPSGSLQTERFQNPPGSFDSLQPMEFNMGDGANTPLVQETSSPPDKAAVESFAETPVKEIQTESAEVDLTSLLAEAEGLIKYKVYGKAGQKLRKVLEADPSNPDAQRLLQEIVMAKGEGGSLPGIEMTNPPDLKESNGQSLAGLALENQVQPENQVQKIDDEKIKEKLAEGEFYVQQGLLGEAKIIYETILKLAPDNALAKMKLKKVSGELNEPEMELTPDPSLESSQPFAEAGQFDSLLDLTEEKTGGEAPASFTPGKIKLKTTILDKTEKTDFVNLAGELEEDFKVESQPPADEAFSDDDFGKIIKEFQRGIQDNIGEKDFETHFNLGIAYKEMGLRTEAIGELQIAIKGEIRAVDSAILLSQFYLEDGLPKLAIEQITQAIQFQHLNSDQIHSLKYELATLYEFQNNFEDAMNVLSDIYKVDVNYRDVSKKISQLRQKNDRKA